MSLPRAHRHASWHLAHQLAGGEARLLDSHSLAEIRLVQYEGEGWGICYDGEQLFMSDGSAWLTIRDADSFEVKDRLQVLIDGQPIEYLNELEYANGAIYANVLFSDIILKIDPKTGQTLDVIDMGWMNDIVFPKGAWRDSNAVLNGIAHRGGPLLHHRQALAQGV